MSRRLASTGFGLSGQAMAVLAMLSELEIDNDRIEIHTWPWYNCRERGVCLEIRASLVAETALLITFGECRNSDNIFIDAWRHVGWFLNPPTIAAFTDEAYERRKYVAYGDVGTAVANIQGKIEAFAAESLSVDPLSEQPKGKH